MGKKVIAVLLMVSALLCGCGGGNNDLPEGISEEAYEKAIQTVELTDLYLKEKLNLEETMAKLYNLDVDFDEDYLNSLSRNEDGELIDENSEYPRDGMVNVSIVDIRLQISTMDFGDDEYKKKTLENIRELRDELAEKINYK